jgi:serine-type D-Ala-D-Ala carboxypeptidase/endopeptidase (penicillin-binding protein 4)
VLAGALAAFALAGCGGSGHHRQRTPEATLVPAATTTAGRTDASRLVPAAPASAAGGRSPALRHLGRALAHDLHGLGHDTGALVYDITTRATLFAVRPGVRRPPASVEKLYTTVAATTLLGGGAVLHTVVFGTGHLRHGIWHGDLYLRGDGDPTFGDGSFNRTYEHGFGPTAAELADQLARDGIHRVSGRVIADESLFDTLRGGPLTGDRPDVGDYGGQLSALVYDHGATAPGWRSPAAFAAHELVLTLRDRGISARASHATATTPASARRLAAVDSPPVSVLLKLMDVPSDDLIADLLTKQLGFRFGGEGTLDAGADEIARTIAAGYGLHPTILDGSGLDKADRSSPAQVVTLLRDIWRTPPGRLLAASLPVVGETGTTQSIAVHTRAQGNCIAKTGTLDFVTNLAGYCDAAGHQMLAFALFVDGPGNWTALAALGHMVGAIAAY